MRGGDRGEELIPTRTEDHFSCARCGQVWQLDPITGQWARAGLAIGTDRPLDEMFEEE